MTTIEAFLREKIGLDCSAIGTDSLTRIIRQRMKNLGLSTCEEYHARLIASPPEYGELLEAVVVGESWFFRDPAALASLARVALKRWLPAHATGKMRVLSLPCASGEEAYSVAMALVDAGVASERFQIDAMDISARGLARARRCVYGKHSFRGKQMSFRRRHFRQADEHFVLSDRIRSLVSFMRGNLLSDDFVAAHSNYDFIMCRNLLIYLDRNAQARALAKIHKLLSPEGLLFVGPAEQPVALDFGFVSAELPRSFACRKPGGTSCAIRQPAPATFSSLSPSVALWDGLPGFRNENVASSSVDEIRSASAQPDLEQARRLADLGCLAEAAALCEAHLRRTQFSAQAYYLLGLVREAKGDSGAIDCYRKALYLQPNHYETLVQLAVLADKNGDAVGARNFHRRAQRLQSNRQVQS